MTEVVNTGGLKEFIRKGDENLSDTASTTEFKEEYKKWLNRPFYKRKKFWSMVSKILLLLLIIFLIKYFILR